MQLKEDWKEILKKAWSVRLLLLAALLTGAEVILPMFSNVIPRGIFASLTFTVVGCALVARVIAQRNMQ